MNSKSVWGTNTVPRQTVTFKDAEWDGKSDKQDPPPTNTQMNQPDSQKDRSQRLIAPTYFEGQYAQRKKRQRIKKQTEEPLPRNGTRQETNFQRPPDRPMDMTKKL